MIHRQSLACAQTFKLDRLLAKIHKFYWSSWMKNGLTFKGYMHQCFLWHSSCSTVLVNEILLRCTCIEEANLKSQRLSSIQAELQGFSVFYWNADLFFLNTNMLSFFLFSTGCWCLPVYIKFLVLYAFHSKLLFPPCYFFTMRFSRYIWFLFCYLFYGIKCKHKLSN